MFWRGHWFQTDLRKCGFILSKMLYGAESKMSFQGLFFKEQNDFVIRPRSCFGTAVLQMPAKRDYMLKALI
jgi:hypothetical protein